VPLLLLLMGEPKRAGIQQNLIWHVIKEGTSLTI
jgi:hypothetical protein